jgi:hypothetical protein
MQTINDNETEKPKFDREKFKNLFIPKGKRKIIKRPDLYGPFDDINSKQ